MPPTGGLAPPLTTKPRSAFVRLRAVTPPPHAPPASAADWTALLAAALPAAFGDADGARLAYRILSTAAGERPGEAVAIVQVRAWPCEIRQVVSPPPVGVLGSVCLRRL